MEVIRAKTAGFCFGVKRAVDTVYEQLEKASESTTIYTYGPIIHNEEVVKDMKQKGIIVLQSEAELDALTEGTVIIRSHGVEKAIYDKLNAKGIKIVDATCPFVKKIHNIVQKESTNGNYIIISRKPTASGSRGNSWLGWYKSCGGTNERRYRQVDNSVKMKRSVLFLKRHLITINLKN